MTWGCLIHTSQLNVEVLEAYPSFRTSLSTLQQMCLEYGTLAVQQSDFFGPIPPEELQFLII